MEILNITSLLIYEAKIHVSLDSVTNVTRFSDQPLMLENYRFHISYYVESKKTLKKLHPHRLRLRLA